MTCFSILDLSPVTLGNTPTEALRNSLDLIRHAEQWGYKRYWVAEHHNMRGIASAATAVVIGYLAGGTSTIRVGAGGIMLPNHAPLVIAEQFGTLATLYPGRIDLGLGRAPGTDQVTAMALRRTLTGNVEDFPRDVVELQHYLKDPQPGQRITAVPGAGTNVPLWILGSSLFGAQLAGMLGLPFAFASHFAPEMLSRAVKVYRDHFKPSEQLDAPYLMLGFNVCAADTNDIAHYLRSSSTLSFLNMRKGKPGLLPPPVREIENQLTEDDKKILSATRRCIAVGDVNAVRDGMAEFIDEYKADELILVSSIYDHSARLHSYEITMNAAREINGI